MIEDYAAACQEGRLAVKRTPHDRLVWRSYIKALAEAGREREMMEAYRESGLDDRQVMETMAWGVLKRGATSPAPMTRIFSMVAGFYAQDIRGVNILHQNLDESNAMLRWVAVQLASELRDTKLQRKIVQLLSSERHPMVRVQAIEAVGKMRCKEAKPKLLQILESGRSTAEERVAAIQSLALLSNSVSRSELQRLIASDRAALRALACQVVAVLEQKKDADLIAPLVDDTHSEVRVAALASLGRIGAASEKVGDPQERVAIHAAWLSTRQGNPEGLRAFERLLSHSDRKVRASAAGALAGCGQYGLELMEKRLNDSDPLVGMNLALGLIGQRRQVDASLRVLKEGLGKIRQRLMWLEEPGYRALVISDVVHQPMIPQYPEAVNQSTRLEILNVMAMLDYSGTHEAMKAFLQQGAWGISGMASALLLTEGDESAALLVEDLLEDPSLHIRLQAALVLSLWGKSSKAIETLQAGYAGASRDLKEKIIEGIGRVGSPASIPFLTDRLEESHQTLRVLAAMALLQCLYH